MKYVRYALLSTYNLIRLSLLSLFHIKKIHFGILQLISPKASLELEGPDSKLIIKRVSILSGTTLRASGGIIQIGSKVFINKNCMIVAQDIIEIGDGTTIGPNVVIYDHDHAFGRDKESEKDPFRKRKVSVGKNVWIGAGVIILKGTTIGDNCVIGAGTIVIGNVPSNTLVTQDRDMKYTKIE